MSEVKDGKRSVCPQVSCRINVNAALGALLHCSDGTPSGNILDLSAGFNFGSGDNGSVVSWSAQGQSTFSRTYSYDFLNRLSTMTAASDYTGCFGLQWSYDAYANRTSQATTPNTGGSCPNFSASFSQSSNRMDNYSYDGAGNLSNDGTHSYFYDAENRLYQVDGSSGYCTSGTGTAATACYTYDAEGRRVETNYGSYQIDQIYDEAGNITDEWYYNPNSFIWFYDHRVFIGRQLLATYGNGSVYFTHPDHLGSARMISDVHGNSYEWMDYFPFGEIAYHGGTYFTNSYFTGDTHDWESNLEHTQFRQYGSPMGRWTSPDPLAGDISDPQSLNRYVYVQNSPLIHTDSSGACVDVDGNGSGPHCPLSYDGGDPSNLGCTLDGISIACGSINVQGADPCTNNECNPINSDGLPTHFVATVNGDYYACTVNGSFSSQGAAGTAAVDCANGQSINENREECGSLYQTSSGSYSFTDSAEGAPAGCGFNPSGIPDGTQYAGFYHTHGAFDINYYNEMFSPQGCNGGRPCDIGLASSPANQGQPWYLGTPGGRVEVFDPRNPDYPLGCVLVGAPVTPGNGISLYPVPQCGH